MYTQVLDPVGDSLFLSAIFAALPLIALFILLGGLKWKAHFAALANVTSIAGRCRLTRGPVLSRTSPSGMSR